MGAAGVVGCCGCCGLAWVLQAGMHGMGCYGMLWGAMGWYGMVWDGVDGGCVRPNPVALSAQGAPAGTAAASGVSADPADPGAAPSPLTTG